MLASVVITQAPAEIIEQANHILESHHEHLLMARILWLFSNAKSTSQGEVLLGKGKKLSPEMRFLSSGCESVDEGYDFVITVSEPQWRGLLATQRAALLDHLLCFCDRKERINRRTGAVSYSWAIRGPDVREFTEIVERHGLWRPSIKRFAQALPRQLELPADQTIEAVLPANRTTTVDQAGIVVETRVEDVDLVALESRRGQLIGEVDEEPDNGHDVTAMLMEYAGDPRPREELLAELDARDAALDAATAPQDEAGVGSEVSHASQSVSAENAQKTDSGAISEHMPDSWRQRVGLGRGLWGKSQA